MEARMWVTIFCTSMGEPSTDSAKRSPMRTLSPWTKAGNEIALPPSVVVSLRVVRLA
jgi:hypothetical protein